MIKILFICHGNICRSTMAEMVLKHMVRERHIDKQFYINSAAVSREELGSGVHPGTKRKLREVGIPCGEHYATLMTRQDYDKYDYLIVMDYENIRGVNRIIGSDPEGKVHLLLDYAGREGQAIADPWYTGNFDVTYDDVIEGCEGFLAYLENEEII